jgi:hypothetical protein
LYKLAARLQRVCAAAVALLVAVFPGSSLSPIATEADEGSTERIERAAAEHAPMQPWLMPDGTLLSGPIGQTQSANWSGYLSTGQSPYTSIVGRWIVPSVTLAPVTSVSPTAPSPPATSPSPTPSPSPVPAVSPLPRVAPLPPIAPLPRVAPLPPVTPLPRVAPLPAVAAALNLAGSSAAGDPADQLSSLWIGIGGAIGDSTLIQLGTEQDVAAASGAATYFAWFEMLPAAQIMLPPQQFPVAPGDIMTASLQCIAPCAAAAQSWTLSMTDQTAGWTFLLPNVAYQSSLASAEWILEATLAVIPPSTTIAVQPLPDFGTTTFSADLVNGVSPGLTPTQAVELIDPNGGSTANPSIAVGGMTFQVCFGSGGVLTPCPPPSVLLAAAVLPSSRSVELGNTATAFATLINAGPATVTGCGIAPITPVSANFAYQTTDPATNAIVGQPNTPVSLAAGAAQSFVVAFSPTAPFDPSDVALGFVCAGLLGPPIFPGLNTSLLSASATPVPDIVALAATASNDGILHLPGNSGANAFAVAVVNLGATAAITATANTGVASLPLAVAICQTNPASGQCLGPAASSASTTIMANATPTFAIFAAAVDGVPFVPQTNRIFVEFSDANGVVRGSTSVAVETQ